MTPADLAIRTLGGDATKLARAAIDTLRAELGREPMAAEIRAVMSLLQGFHGEMAKFAGAAEADAARYGLVSVCGARHAAWFSAGPVVRTALRDRDSDGGITVPCDEMRIPCSCGAKEYEFCREEAAG